MYQTNYSFVRGANYCVQKRFCNNALKKEQIESLYSLKGTEMACFGNSSGLFQVHNLVQNFCKKRHEEYVSLRCARSTKSLSKAHTHKICTRIFNSFSSEINFMWTSGFYRYEHLYADRRMGFQNIYRKICNCLGQLLHIY